MAVSKVERYRTKGDAATQWKPSCPLNRQQRRSRSSSASRLGCGVSVERSGISRFRGYGPPVCRLLATWGHRAATCVCFRADVDGVRRGIRRPSIATGPEKIAVRGNVTFGRTVLNGNSCPGRSSCLGSRRLSVVRIHLLSDEKSPLATWNSKHLPSPTARAQARPRVSPDARNQSGPSSLRPSTA